MDGVLFDTEKLYQEVWAELASEYDVALGSGFLKDISGTNGAHMRRIVERYYRVPDGTPVIEACMHRMKERLEQQVPVKAGVRDVLEYFRQKEVPIAVASSSSAEQIKHNLNHSGLRDYFAAVVSGEDVVHGKPAPDIFLLAAEKIGCSPEECLVFEDSANGVKAGCVAGCCTIMIPDLIEPSGEIRKICPNICENFFQAMEDLEKRCFVISISVK